MTDVNLDTIFPSLEAQAARLNVASDDANRLLAAIEKRLLSLNIGLEVWHAEPVETADSDGTLGAHETSSCVVQMLGLARVEGKWCLAVKPMRFVSGFFEGDMSCPFQNQYAAGTSFPLLKASRGLRIAALQAMPKFLDVLSRDVASRIREIEETADMLGQGHRG